MNQAVLGQVADVIDCEHRTAPRSTPGEAVGYSIGTHDVRDGRVDFLTAKPVDRATFSAWTTRAVPSPPDLVFTREAPAAEVALVPGNIPVCLGQRTVLIRPNLDAVIPEYLKYYIMAPKTQRWIGEKSLGSTVRHLNVADVRRMPMGALPSVKAQRRIVEGLEDHLSRLDAAQAVLKSATIRAETFVATAVWQLTHTGSSRRRRLDEIAEVRLGRQRSPKNHEGDRMRPYLRAANVDWKRLRLDDVNEMQFTIAESSIYQLRAGDILLTEASGSAGEVGKSCVYGGRYPTRVSRTPYSGSDASPWSQSSCRSTYWPRP